MFLRFRRRTAISDLAEGCEAVIEGKVTAKTPLKVPHAGVPCVFFDVFMESYGVGARGRGRPLWLPVRAEVKCSGFFVEDETGKVWVAGDERSYSVSGCRQKAGIIGKSGRQRYVAKYFQEGDVVRIRGAISKPVKGQPPDVLVMAPGRKGRLEILVR
jgi:hypothetical protein